jgi:hypothetical protein
MQPIRQQVQTIQSRVRGYAARVRIWHIVAIAMILTGFLYPTARYTLQEGMIALVGEFGFYVWCTSLIVCGLGIFVYPRGLIFWLMPLLFIGVSQAIVGSNTAIIYYAVLWLFPLYRWYIEQQPGRKLLLGKIRISQVAGVLHLTMAFVLFVDPNGAGMELLYNALHVWMAGIIESVLFYQLFYLVTGIILLYPLDYGRYLQQILYLPFVTHGLTFAFISVTVFNTWVFVPLFVAITAIWWSLAEVAHD